MSRSSEAQEDESKDSAERANGADSPEGPAWTVAEAVEAFRGGGPVLIHDAADREGETDLVSPAGAVTPSAVARMRNDAGGLVCVALSAEVADAFDLPFLHEAVRHPTTADRNLSYDDRHSFSLTVNHRDTTTGITDDDRALTITALAEAAADAAAGEVDREDFSGTFGSPGHVHLLRGARGGLSERVGHTELGLALAEAAHLPPAVVVCEMLDDETGGARPPAAARAYADRHGFPYVEGAAIIERFG
jgi:3,4-dihydroxy 2-butanone 4-phosphate synthase